MNRAAPRFRKTRVVLAAAHLDSDPTNNWLRNLRALCQRCHMLHDRPHHLAQRWISLPPALGSRRFFSRPVYYVPIRAMQKFSLLDQRLAGAAR
jgi:hypothetical protein